RPPDRPDYDPGGTSSPSVGTPFSRPRDSRRASPRALRSNRAWPFLRSSPEPPAVIWPLPPPGRRRLSPKTAVREPFDFAYPRMRAAARPAKRAAAPLLRRGRGLSPFPSERRASGPLLVVVLDFLELGVDDIVIAAPGLLALGRPRRLLAVDLLHEPRRDVAERPDLRLDAALAVALEGLLELAQRALHLRPLVRRHLVAEIGERLLGCVHERVALVLDV